MRILKGILMLCLVLGLTAGYAAAQAAPAAAAAPAGGPKAEAARNFLDAAEKAVRLAEKIPADKYTWRPTPDVRSFSEVFMHMAGGNFSIPRRLGATVPADIQLSPTFDKSQTEKEKVLAILKQSVEHGKKAIEGVADADVEKTAPWFGGRQATMREIMFFLASHNHEHLGQLIAYTRMAGMVPPWTEEAQQRQAPPKKSN